MNTVLSLIIRWLRILESKLSAAVRPHPVRRPRFEEQLEFPWHSKR
jgi:hypothetical protein